MKDVITKTQVLNHPINKVWDAISKAEELSTWFIAADFKAEVGYHYTFTSDEKEGCEPILGVVQKADPYTLIYTWEVKGTQVETTVKWELEDLGGKTKLYLEHSGISQYAGETAIKMYSDFNGGWDNCISLLDDYLIKAVHAE
ncbi:SRPBCC family protein [Flagellimonas sp.]|uniref:SRPBCC family protein n=1 Tax=Flagellimonas sp. TaxID=2058762 RepID=UPI003F4A7DBE